MPNQNKTPQVRQTDAADAASALVVLLARVAALVKFIINSMEQATALKATALEVGAGIYKDFN